MGCHLHQLPYKDNKVTHAKNLISYEEFITASVVSHYSVDIL